MKPVLGRFKEVCPANALEFLIDDAPIDSNMAAFGAAIALGESSEKVTVAVELGVDMHEVASASPACFRWHGTPATETTVVSPGANPGQRTLQLGIQGR